ncbi:MAG: fibronectin type III domain-containing protein, partial [Verrucomicrobiales bacterium]|nr:fibronectin type III domain-containing protein [Verrucomicrobiales bacterium]
APVAVGPTAAGPITPAPSQPAGALSGRIVFTSAGHGWTYTTAWNLQRGVLVEMNEDYGNLDQMTLFAFYCFNAGATVVPLRPVGHQTNEVVLDNTSAGVSFSGTWSTDSTSAVYWGASTSSRFRFATVASSETAVATYTPTIPVAGFYPVYTWVPHGTNRVSQLYKINHPGGQALVRVPHNMVGNGWVYLGTYYFNAGASAANGSVQISNLEPAPGTTGIVIADGIRFGNGMGSIDRGGGISRYPREEECSRYWVQHGLGNGQSSSIYDGTGDDVSDNTGTPPRMAAAMNREDVGNMFKRVYLGFHSNATTGDTNTATARGSIGLYNNESLFPGTATPNQFRWAQIVGREVTWDMTNLNALLEYPWYDRGSGVTYARSDFAFGEINNQYINNEFDATIIEVAFHDNVQDATLLRDPKVRNWVARAAYHAVVKYMNEFDGAPLQFLPEPPYNVRAVAVSNGIAISWNTPIAQSGSGAPTGYVVYISTNGYAFGSPVSVSGGATTSVTLTNLAADTDYYFRVAAINAGGESFPSETVGCRRAAHPAWPKALFINAFDRFDRTTNLRQTPARTNYVPPGNSGSMERVLPRANNAFDYVVPHGKAISAFGLAFDSAQRQAVTNNQVLLTHYPIVIWSAGQSLTNTFRAIEQNRVSNFLSGGGHLFVSGADIAWDLDRSSGPSAADRAFLNNQLRADLGDDVNNNSLSYTVSPATGSIFAGNPNATFDDGNRGIYWVKAPDVLTPVGSGATAALNYVGGIGGAAAVQYNGSAGGGKVVYFGFPFETITNATVRNDYMQDVLNFFALPPTIATQPQSQTIVQGGNVVFAVTAIPDLWGLAYQWRLNGTNLPGATASTYAISNVQPAHAGDYSVVVSNAGGAVTSLIATLTVLVPPLITQQPQDQTVVAGQNATFSVVAGGSAPLFYQWRFYGTNLPGATGSVLTLSNVL